MTTFIANAGAASNGPGFEAGWRASSARQVLAGFVFLAAGWLAGCASSGPAPLLDNDLPAFSAAIDGMLKVGQSFKQARSVLKEHMPPPSIDTQVAAPVPTANVSMRVRRYMIAWPTTTHGTTFVLTIFCDPAGNVVRWTTGPLTSER